MINLELSNLCNLNCGFCLRRAYDDEGKNQIMKLELLERILPELNQLEMIDLTGWGEPMAHPKFELCLEKIRKNFSGFLSLTSNGTLLDEQKIQALIDAQVNIICFSQTLHAQWQTLVDEIPVQKVALLAATELTLAELGYHLITQTADMTVLSGTKAAMMAQLLTPAACAMLVATIPFGTVVVA